MIPQTYASTNPCQVVAGVSFTAPSSCNISGLRARKRAMRSGATAIQLSRYRFGNGKISTCNIAETIASSHALRSIRRIVREEYQEEAAARVGRPCGSDIPVRQSLSENVSAVFDRPHLCVESLYHKLHQVLIDICRRCNAEHRPR